MTITYKEYIITVENRTYKIVEKLPDGKFRTRRHSMGTKWSGKRNQLGNKLYYAFKTDEEALISAQNYIDNHIKPWSVRLKELRRDK